MKLKDDKKPLRDELKAGRLYLDKHGSLIKVTVTYGGDMNFLLIANTLGESNILHDQEIALSKIYKSTDTFIRVENIFDLEIQEVL